MITGSYLILAPHPDDEVFGCGGLLAECAKGSNKTNVLFLTDGEASHRGCCTMPENDIGLQRRHLAGTANALLGVSQDRLHYLQRLDGKLPHTGNDGFLDLVDTIGNMIDNLDPDVVLCPYPFEGWSDHVAAEELTRTALLRLTKRPKLYYYCVWFWYSVPLMKAWNIDWRRARLLDISTQLPLKKIAIQTYLHSLASCGNPMVGKLPPEFLRAFDWDKELFFEADMPEIWKIKK